MIAINQLVYFILFLVILLVVIVLLTMIAGPSSDQINLQNKLRQCCIAYRGNNCQNPATIFCDNGPDGISGTGDETRLDTLMLKLNMQQSDVNIFCSCK